MILLQEETAPEQQMASPACPLIRQSASAHCYASYATYATGRKLMLGDGLTRFGSVMEMSYAHEVDRQLKKELQQQYDREAAIEELQQVTRITELAVLNELVDCGLRADSMHVLTLFPMVHVSWANGYVERSEREEILKAAETEGLKPETEGFILLTEWLSTRPDAALLKTWKDYVSALRLVLGTASFNALRDSTISRAVRVAESAGGCLGLGAVSRREQTAIDELKASFLV